MRKASSISARLFLGFVRGQTTSKLRCFNAVRFHCDRAQPSSIKPPGPGPLTQYKSLVEQGKLQHDPKQETVAFQLEELLGRLEQYEREMEDYHEKLAIWEGRREEERRKLLMEEAESQQKDDVWTSVTNQRNKFVQRWLSRKKPDKAEPGVGKWVSYLNRERKLDSRVGRRPTAPPAPKGLYIYGNVGSGKTMLMDMFFSATEGIVKHRKRYHFHEAMLKINEQMHQIWKSQVEEKSLHSSLSNWVMNLPFDSRVKEWVAAEERYKQEVQMKNILPAVADKLLIDRQANQKGGSILCFDEIQTVDVFAIVALSGIVSRLLSTGTVFVATSNRAPTDLNQDGMQREIFQKFVRKLNEHCETVLIGSEIDYRRVIAQSQRSADQVHYFCPSDSVAMEKFKKKWHEVTNQIGGQIASDTIQVMFGRTLEVPECSNGVARFTFDYLCGRPARRFITLIDELYNHHCRLFCSAASSIDELFQGTEEGTLFDLESFQFETETEGSKLRRDVLAEGNVSSGGAPTGIISMLSGQEEMFAFRRAVSRLIEMQTPVYLEGVRSLHPYFQKQRRGFESVSSRNIQPQLSY
ncbi:hypothetical protein C1H46_033154 [Malus baccata]|uniref:AAA+ ATPase domain-containing protein n=1 Tax=Malus baccata TaxID=106549 RepID=A0A540L4L6_MALBA|nr:hypothetical protein C1H46_033154 [Malus baccata]